MNSFVRDIVEPATNNYEIYALLDVDESGSHESEGPGNEEDNLVEKTFSSGEPCLEFVGKQGGSIDLQVKRKVQHRLKVSKGGSLTGVFNIVLLRKEYQTFPIDCLDGEGKNVTPFDIFGADQVEYLPIRHNQEDHFGARIILDKTKEIFILFKQASTYLSHRETNTYKLTPHKAKQMQLLLIGQDMTASLNLQVVCEVRPNQTRKQPRPQVMIEPAMPQFCPPQRHQQQQQQQQPKRIKLEIPDVEELRQKIQQGSKKITNPKRLQLILTMIEELAD